MELCSCFLLLCVLPTISYGANGDSDTEVRRLPTKIVTDDVYDEVLLKKKTHEVQALKNKYTAREKKLYTILKNEKIVYRTTYDLALERDSEHLAYIAEEGEVIIPRGCDVPIIIEYFYNTFRGENAFKLWARIRRSYANISKKRIQLWLNNCQEHGAEFPVFQNKRKLKPVLANRPMDQLQVDLVDFSSRPCEVAGTTYRYVFACLDVFSRFVVLHPMKEKTPVEAARIFKMVVSLIGLPKRLQTDRGSEFKGVFQDMVEFLGPKWIRSSPYHPQSQGKIEKSHGTWKKKLQFDLERGSGSWSESLHEYAYQYNTGAHQSLGGMSPFEVFYGRKPIVDRVVYEEGHAFFDTKQSNIKKWHDEQQSFFTSAHVHSTKSAEKMVARHRKNRPPSTYSLADKVIVKPFKMNKKFWKGKHRMRNYVGVVSGVRGDLYKVLYQNEKGIRQETWFPVSAITSQTRESERSRQRATRHDSHRSPSCVAIAPNSQEIRTRPDAAFQQDEKQAIQEGLKEESIDVGPLVRLLADRNLEVVNVAGDGDCFFHAVAHQLYGSADIHREVRSRGIDYIVNHIDEFIDVIDGNDVNKFIDVNMDSGSWADHEMIQAVCEAYDVNIEIINSDPRRYAPTVISPRRVPSARNSRRWITLGAVEQLHYVSTRPIFSSNLCSWGGVTSDGCTLVNTCALDGPLSFLMLMMHFYPDMMTLQGENMDFLRSTFHLFLAGKLADAKHLWFHNFVGTHLSSAHAVCNMHGSEAQQFFEPISRSPLGSMRVTTEISCDSPACKKTTINNHRTLRLMPSQNIEASIKATFKPKRQACNHCGELATALTRVLGPPPPLLIIPADGLSNWDEFSATLQIPIAGYTPTYVLMYIGIKLSASDHFVAFFRVLREPWHLFDSLKSPLVHDYKQPIFLSSYGCVTFLIYVALKHVGKAFKSLKNEVRRLTRDGTQRVIDGAGRQKRRAPTNYGASTSEKAKHALLHPSDAVEATRLKEETRTTEVEYHVEDESNASDEFPIQPPTKSETLKEMQSLKPVHAKAADHGKEYGTLSKGLLIDEEKVMTLVKQMLRSGELSSYILSSACEALLDKMKPSSSIEEKLSVCGPSFPCDIPDQLSTYLIQMVPVRKSGWIRGAAASLLILRRPSELPEKQVP